jgi:Metallopeptidase family M24
MSYQQHGFSETDLSRFREVQRLAYQCTVEISHDLTEGVTEIEACARMESWLRKRGVQDFFHKPFAWFGPRAAFEGFWNKLQFFPTRTRLKQDMAYILDVAPVVDGYIGDIGYSAALGENTVQTQMRRCLIEYRGLILQGVKAGKRFAQIYREVDAFIQHHGYQNAHRRYPQRVLAHRVAKVEPNALSGLTLLGFGARHLQWLVPQVLRARFLPQAGDGSPLWNDGAESEHVPLLGVWAVEPHLAFHGVGAKWEEILVITEKDAYWLDEEVPHMQEARAQGWIEVASLTDKEMS